MNFSTSSVERILHISGKVSLIVNLILHDPLVDAIFKSSAKIVSKIVGS